MHTPSDVSSARTQIWASALGYRVKGQLAWRCGVALRAGKLRTVSFSHTETHATSHEEYRGGWRLRNRWGAPGLLGVSDPWPHLLRCCQGLLPSVPLLCPATGVRPAGLSAAYAAVKGNNLDENTKRKFQGLRHLPASTCDKANCEQVHLPWRVWLHLGTG